MSEQFRPGPAVTRSEDFLVDVKQKFPNCEDHEHEYIPSEQAMDEWYKLFYELTGMEYGPPNPYAHEMLTLEVVPVLGVKHLLPTYVGLIGTYLEEKPVLGQADPTYGTVEVSTLLQVDAHGGVLDHISFAVVDKTTDDVPPAEAWRPFDHELSMEVARMMSRYYTTFTQHTRRQYSA